MRGRVDQKTAVLVGELHNDLGFEAPLLCMADQLIPLAAERGCRLRTVFVLNDPIYFGHEVAAHGHAVLPAPVVERPVEITSYGRSYANRLASMGFAHEHELRMHVEAWDRLFTLLSADIVIADNS